MSSRPGDITRLLAELRAGASGAESRLMDAVYPELRRIATRYFRRERQGHTLQATVLVGEVYERLVKGAEIDWHGRSHFFAVAARSMRRVLVDYAKNHKAAKHSGGLLRVELADALAISGDRLEEALAVDEALTRLAEWDPRQSRVVEMKFFGGLTEAEIADVLGVSARTVIRDWNLAKAWLHAELKCSA